jgi:hypothetical protein
MRARITEMPNLRNLAHRPARPAYRRGAVQRRAIYAMITLGGTASTRQVMDWTCALKVVWGGRLGRHNYRAARRALEQMGAERIGRASTQGRPILWRWSDNRDTED